MFLYLQIFAPVLWMRFCCYAGGAVITLFYIPSAIAQLYYTTPRPGESWAESFQNPLYDKTYNLIIPITAVGLVFDLFILILPIAAVLQLQMSLRRKLCVSLMFMTGFAQVSHKVETH